MNRLLQDLGYRLRQWRSNPGFAAVALVSLAKEGAARPKSIPWPG